MQYYTLDELSYETGIPARRIRFWIEQGLVPKSVNERVPRGKQRSRRWGVYTYDHVRRVLAVAELFENNYSIKDARDHFNPIFPEGS